MIVLHGTAGIAEEATAYTISFDNINYEVVREDEMLHDNIVPDNAKTDGTAAGPGATIKVKIKTANVQEISLAGGSAEGEMNSLQSIGSSGGWTKEEYLSEVYAFMGSARVDFSISSVSYNSPKDGNVFGMWTSTTPKDGFDLNKDGKGKINITITKEGEDQFVMEYNTKDVVQGQSCDWHKVSSLKLELNVITKAGSISSEEKVMYYHADAPITSMINMEGGKYLTFDSSIATIGGWWETSEVPVRRRFIAKEGMSTRESMFRYLIYGSISPAVFSSNIRNMIFTASRSGSEYTLDRVMSNNLYECPSLSGLGISSSGPGIEGAATILANEPLGTISIDTSGASTTFGEMYIELSDAECANSCKFQIGSGLSSSENFVGAAADAVVLYNQITGRGTTEISGTNIDNQVVGFHLFINGLQEFLLQFTYNPAHQVFGLMSMGITCGLTGNMIDFVFFLYYERIKMILWGVERRLVMSGITSTQEHYLSSMSHAQKGVDASIRRKIAKQWLIMTDSQHMRAMGPMVYRTFFLEFACTFIGFEMPDSVPYTFGLPMYGVPMNEDIVESTTIENQIATDEVIAMMRKNAHYSMYRTRMDWAMALGGQLSDYATYWAWGGSLVTIIRDGKHQELYSSNDPAYALHSTDHTDPVATHGEIGEKWNEFRGAMLNPPRFVAWNKFSPVSGGDAQELIKLWRNPSVPVMHGLSASLIINLDDDTLSISGGEFFDAVIQRPNKNVIIAFKKQE